MPDTLVEHYETVTQNRMGQAHVKDVIHSELNKSGIIAETASSSMGIRHFEDILKNAMRHAIINSGKTEGTEPYGL